MEERKKKKTSVTQTLGSYIPEAASSLVVIPVLWIPIGREKGACAGS